MTLFFDEINSVFSEPPSPVFVKDYGVFVIAEYRVGPEVTCTAKAIKNPDRWIIDGIETLPEWRGKGHASAVLRLLVELSGMPVNASIIDRGAEGFWEKMTRRGINV